MKVSFFAGLTVLAVLGAFLGTRLFNHGALADEPASAAEMPEGWLAACPCKSFSPKVVTIYGNQTTILRDVEEFVEPVIGTHRAYVVLVENEASAELLVVVHPDGNPDRCTVERFAGPARALHGVIARIHEELLANKGVLCVGEQVQTLLKKHLGDDLTSSGLIPAPTNLKSLIRHPLKRHADKYSRLTLLLLC